MICFTAQTNLGQPIKKIQIFFMFLYTKNSKKKIFQELIYKLKNGLM